MELSLLYYLLWLLLSVLIILHILWLISFTLAFSPLDLALVSWASFPVQLITPQDTLPIFAMGTLLKLGITPLTTLTLTVGRMLILLSCDMLSERSNLLHSAPYCNA
ncbi:hypothetical protein C7974DRAFT_405292 [Boeremia exigua]|uniref:uncharacterized protein n=1 Tax=Boeremia exigua TaxID=749465 RepID=UPI001E8CCD3A|nr:uncharacterized protein C7974DRAFT_405292 [Boeremia exigua]KAH6613170.1 hypothetical protein C7974DRAFT_405292 [Boeremia exigua]